MSTFPLLTDVIRLVALPVEDLKGGIRIQASRNQALGVGLLLRVEGPPHNSLTDATAPFDVRGLEDLFLRLTALHLEIAGGEGGEMAVAKTAVSPEIAC